MYCMYIYTYVPDNACRPTAHAGMNQLNRTLEATSLVESEALATEDADVNITHRVIKMLIFSFH